MNIYSYLKKDHQTVDKLFDRFLTETNQNNRHEIFNELAMELIIHSETENATFYEALKTHDITKDLVKHGKEEHNEIKKYLGQLIQSPMNANEWMDIFHKLRKCVLHHVQEEEGSIFPKAQLVLSEEQAETLAVDMHRIKEGVKEELFEK